MLPVLEIHTFLQESLVDIKDGNIRGNSASVSLYQAVQWHIPLSHVVENNVDLLADEKHRSVQWSPCSQELAERANCQVLALCDRTISVIRVLLGKVWFKYIHSFFNTSLN